jgi:hypothetical protein
MISTRGTISSSFLNTQFPITQSSLTPQHSITQSSLTPQHSITQSSLTPPRSPAAPKSIPQPVRMYNGGNEVSTIYVDQKSSAKSSAVEVRDIYNFYKSTDDEVYKQFCLGLLQICKNVDPAISAEIWSERDYKPYVDDREFMSKNSKTKFEIKKGCIHFNKFLVCSPEVNDTGNIYPFGDVNVPYVMFEKKPLKLLVINSDDIEGALNSSYANSSLKIFDMGQFDVFDGINNMNEFNSKFEGLCSDKKREIDGAIDMFKVVLNVSESDKELIIGDVLSTINGEKKPKDKRVVEMMKDKEIKSDVAKHYKILSEKYGEYKNKMFEALQGFVNVDAYEAGLILDNIEEQYEIYLRNDVKTDWYDSDGGIRVFSDIEYTIKNNVISYSLEKYSGLYRGNYYAFTF